jgi:hypothetical protein
MRQRPRSAHGPAQRVLPGHIARVAERVTGRERVIVGDDDDA